MRKRKQKPIRIPKAPIPIAGAQSNLSGSKDPQARRLGMSALKNTILSSPNLDAASSKSRRRASYPDFNVNSIQSYPELLAALDAEAVQITLGANIIAPDNILINHDVAINFNGYNIISEETNPGARVLDIRSGEVTLTGKGKIFAMGARSVAIRVFGAISIGMPAYTTLTIDDGISLFAPDSYGILISPNLGVAYGLSINLSGEIIARDGIGLSSHIRGRETNLPTINIRSGARITADETCGSALEAAGYAIWNIGAAKLTGATGALLKSGQINFSHTEIIATGAAFIQAALPESLDAPEALLEDPTPQNSAIRIASAAKHDLNITVEGGSYLGEKSFAVAGDPSSLESFVIKGGDFSGALDVLHHAIETELDIEEGSFSLHPALHLKALKPEIILLPEPEPEPYPKEIIEALKPVPKPDPAPTPEKPTQKLPMPPSYDKAECAEKITMANALSEAITEMKNLKSSDYEVGFVDLEAAIHAAEQLLAGKIITLPAIRDASAKLLEAFDSLEERDEFSLTDDELDELFYHGAILDELASEPAEKAVANIPIENSPTSDPAEQPSTTTKKVELEKTAPNPTPAPEEIPNLTQPVPTSAVQQPTTPQPAPSAPDLSALANLISQISALDPSHYTLASYNILLSELAQVKPLLTNAAQVQIDIAVHNLSARLASLVPAQPTSPQSSLTNCLINEAVPTRNWSTGVTSIDETDPHLCLAKPLPKSLRKKFRSASSPVSNFFKSISAGLRAGFDVYQKTRHATK